MLTIQRLKTLGKLYLGLTVAYGGCHALQNEPLRPAQHLAIIVASPLVWPVYMASDLHKSQGRVYPALGDDS
jgi:hypothetical protein